MTLNITMQESEELRAIFDDENMQFVADFGEAHVLSKDMIFRNTVEGWNRQRDLVSYKNGIYIYTDYQTEEDEQGNIKYIPGIKIGDGKAFLIDLPFTDDLMIQHIEDLGIHVTPEEKEFWNNKVRTYYSEVDYDTLVFTTN